MPWYSGIGSFGSCIERGGVVPTNLAFGRWKFGRVFWISKGIPTWRIIPFSKWLITMVIVSPQDLGLWDPFQAAELHGL